MFNKFPIQGLLFFMVFSCLLLVSSSLQTTRKVLSKDENFSIQTTVVKENVIDDGEESMVMERMNLEIEDYPGTGANNNHDPKPPGRV
ncbi:uncharacterized protein LOC123884964 [Trifolium pratense]|uniref:uncharacterized protein LOC123884964 n=1 Tax=Trifolium pratense TaxID=57577 RepID=UPI001E694D38|nr:uncharacterized protein LOC123884964 [Trifolium pratense]